MSGAGRGGLGMSGAGGGDGDGRAPRGADAFWEAAARAAGRLRALAAVPLCMLGCGLARAWLGWMLGRLGDPAAVPAFSQHEGQLLFDAGEVAGFFLLALAAYRGRPCSRSPLVLVGAPALATLAGAATLLPALAGEAARPAWFALALAGGLAYAAMLLSWLELYGCMAPRRMLVAWSSSYLVSFALWGVYSNMGALAAGVLASAFPAASAFMLVAGFLRVPERRWPDVARAGGGAASGTAPQAPGGGAAGLGAPLARPEPLAAAAPAGRAALGGSVALPRPAVPWKYVWAVTAIVFALGVGDVLADRQVFSATSRLAMALAEGFVLVGALFFSDRFGLKTVLSVVPPVAGAGVLLAFFLEGVPGASQLMLVVGSELCLVLSYTVGCTLAYRTGTSAAGPCGVFAGLNKLFLQLGKWAGVAASGALGGSAGLAMTLAACAVVAASGAAILRDPDLVERLSWDWQNAQPRNLDLAHVVERYGLTEREAAVLQLLARGDATAQMAEELFCAQGTVRAHVSNIYRKLGVHSRAEMAEKFSGLVEQARRG